MFRHLCAKPLFEVILNQFMIWEFQNIDFFPHSFLQEDLILKILLTQLICGLTQICTSDNLNLYSVVVTDIYSYIYIYQ